MKAKLIKEGSFGYKIKFHNDNDMAACALGLLSLKNCQAIERGYDLDELAIECMKNTINQKTGGDNHKLSLMLGFQKGFQKALELMGDKKFSEEDMVQAFLKGVSLQVDTPTFQQSLQQTEWDVEIEMEEAAIGDKYTPEPKPKLDADGCLILKLKSE